MPDVIPHLNLRHLACMHPYGSHLQRSRYSVHCIVVGVPVGNHSAQDITIRNLVAILFQKLAPGFLECPTPAAKRVGIKVNCYTARTAFSWSFFPTIWPLQTRCRAWFFFFCLLFHFLVFSIPLPEIARKRSIDSPLSGSPQLLHHCVAY